MTDQPLELPKADLGLWSRVPVLAGQDVDVLQSLANAAITTPYQAGTVIFMQGDPAQGLSLVESGSVKISRIGRDGREQILGLFQAGEAFNEVSALDGGPNPATATAHTDAVVSCVCRPDLIHLGETYPALVWALAAQVADHSRQLIEIVVDLALRSVRGRLAHLLLEEAQAHESDVIPRYLTQEEMAARLGTVREMVGRALRSLTAEGVIEIERHRIVIVDPKRLAELAEA